VIEPNEEQKESARQLAATMGARPEAARGLANYLAGRDALIRELERDLIALTLREAGARVPAPPVALPSVPDVALLCSCAYRGLTGDKCEACRAAEGK
jgi:hypothetical protein